MEFSKILMNPPYDETLHLLIFLKSIKFSKFVINLSPCQWLYNAVISYKSQYKNIIKKFSDLKGVSIKKVNTRDFDVEMWSRLGIYQYNYYDKCSIVFEKNSIIEKIRAFIKKHGTIHKHFVEKTDLNKHYFRINRFHGHPARKKIKDLYEWISTDKSLSIDYNKSISDSDRFVEFETLDECENFYKFLFSKIMIYINVKCKFTMDNLFQFCPFLDYKYEWTDKQLYELFGLTDEEINEVENETNLAYFSK